MNYVIPDWRVLRFGDKRFTPFINSTFFDRFVILKDLHRDSPNGDKENEITPHAFDELRLWRLLHLHLRMSCGNLLGVT